MNRCFLIGNLTKDPELRTTGTGLSVCSFSIGVSRRFANQDGERESDFFNIVVWRKQAENAAKYLLKGSQVGIAGTIQNKSYDAKDGTKRYITEIIADEVQFLGGGQKQSDRAHNNLGKGSTAANGNAIHEIHEDMPF